MVYWLIFYFSVALAQQGRHLSFAEAVKLIRQNNPELQAAEMKLVSTQALEGIAAAGFYPQVAANLDGSQTTIAGNTASSHSANLSLSQNLFAGFGDQSKWRVARANTEVAKANLVALKSRLSLDLKTAFQGVIYSEESIRLTKDVLLRRRENLRIVELLFQSGRENRGSLLLSKAHLAQAEYDDLQAQNSRAVAQAQLARVLGLEEQPIYIEGIIPQSEPVKPPPNFQTLAQSSPDFLNALSTSAADEAAMGTAAVGFWPSLTASAAVGKTGTDFFPQTDKWSAGLSLSFPLFSGFRDQSNLQSARALFHASKALEHSVRRRVLVELRESYTSFVQSSAKLKVDESFRDAAQLRAEIARKNYNNGLLKFENWDPIENDFIIRQKTFLQSRRDRVIAEAKWENAQGLGALP